MQRIDGAVLASGPHVDAHRHERDEAARQQHLAQAVVRAAHVPCAHAAVRRGRENAIVVRQERGHLRAHGIRG
eukprot:scaffold159144_cov25-Tisochrysis_lutea.AAC.5